MVDEGLIRVNGEEESRRRRKLRANDRIDIALDPEESWKIVADEV